MNRSIHTSELDQLLWNIIVLDDEKAYEQLFTLFYPPLLGYAKKYIENQFACEDIVQEIFVLLWENRKALQITRSVRNYLLTAVRNHCLNYLKREGFARQYHEFIIEKQLSGNENENNEFFLLKELQELLYQALAKLPEPYRRVFEMRRIENQSYESIAEELHISVRTAKRYKSHVMDRLREELRDYLPMLLF